MVGVLSPFLTCEEAYLLAKFLKGLSAQVRLALGPVPVVGEDDTYPKDRRGKPAQPVKFTIRAEKCPNRRGVEEVLRHFQGEVLAFDDVAQVGGGRQGQGALPDGRLPAAAGRLGHGRPGRGAEKGAACRLSGPFAVAGEQVRPVRPAGGDVRGEGRHVRQPRGLAQAMHGA